MSALTADRNTLTKGTVLVAGELPAAVDIFYVGAAVCLNAAGYVAPVTATLGDVFLGICTEYCDNSGGSEGDLNCKFQAPVLARWDASGLSQSDVGSDCYLSDDHTITTTPGNCYAGKIQSIESATVAWVNHYRALLVAESWDLADAAAATFGTGSDVAIAFDGTNLEMLPATDDLAAFNIGDGTTDMDFKVFMGTTAKYVLFDNSTALVTFEDTDLHLGDNDILQFGDAAGGDVAILWNATNLTIKPKTDDTGAIVIGDGTTDMDLIVTMGTAAKLVTFDNSAAKVIFDDVDLALGDNDVLIFGDGSDVTLTWNGTNLVIAGLPTSDPSAAGALYTTGGAVLFSAG